MSETYTWDPPKMKKRPRIITGGRRIFDQRRSNRDLKNLFLKSYKITIKF